MDPEAWDMTVIRAQGLSYMRPEKAWRPIVTVEVDKSSAYEMVLGVDGQNPNLKQGHRFYDVKPTSTVEIKVWHRSQSKKKSKKRNLVAVVSSTLGDLVKRLETGFSPSSSRDSLASPRLLSKGSGKNQIDLRLSCQGSSRKPSSSSKGRPQNGALLTVKLTPPTNLGLGWRLSAGSSPRITSRSASRLGLPDMLEVNDNHTKPVDDKTLLRRDGYSSDSSAASSSCSSHPSSSPSHSRAHSLSNSNTLIDVQPPSAPTSPTHHSPTSSAPSPPSLRRRRVRRKRVQGYALFSDEDRASASSYSCSESGSSSSSVRLAEQSHGSSTSFFGDAVRSTPLDSAFDSYSDTDDLDIKGVDLLDASIPRTIPIFIDRSSKSKSKTTTTTTTDKSTTATETKRTSITRWIAASLLPQHVLSQPVASSSKVVEEPCNETEDVPPYTETDITAHTPATNDLKRPLSPTSSVKKGKSTRSVELEQKTPKNAWWETLLDNFTFYLSLRSATLDSEFESILSQQRMEWTFMGGFLAALGAVDVAVLAIDADTPLIPLTPVAMRAIALSSTFTGLGLCALAYFILRYSLSSPALFRSRARDVYGSYVFFSIGARVPTLCMVISAVGVMGFLALVAFEVWPGGVVLGCGIVGALMSLQFLVYGVHMCARGVIGAGRGVVKGVGRAVGFGARGSGSGVVRPIAGV